MVKEGAVQTYIFLEAREGTGAYKVRPGDLGTPPSPPGPLLTMRARARVSRS